MRILPTRGSEEPSVRPLSRAARAANAKVNALRRGDGVAGPAESAGEAGTLLLFIPLGRGTKARTAGSGQ